jgi:signal transduction histidine kinase
LTRDRKIFYAAAVAVGVVALVDVAWVAFQIGGERSTTAFSNLVAIAAPAFAAVAAFRTGRGETGQTRRAWFALGAAVSSWTAGQAIWTYYELFAGRAVPFPSLADAGYLEFIPLTMLALLYFPTAPHSMGARLRALLDGLIIAGSVLFVGWALVIGPAFDAAMSGIAEQVLTLAYPLGDLVTVAIVVYVFARSANGDRAALAWIGGGLILKCLGDSAFTYLTVFDLYATGSLIDPLGDIGFLLIALGALRKPSFSREHGDERISHPGSILAPYAPSALAAAVAIFVQVSRGGLDPFLFWTMIAVASFLGARQILTLVDNWSLNRDLEARVQHRTAALSKALSELEESKRLQDEFVANTSHELLTPVRVMTAALDFLSYSENGDDISATVEMAKRATVRMKRLVEDVLLTSGVMHRVDCERIPFDVEEQIHNALANVMQSDKQIEVDVRGPLMGVGDPDRFRNALQNLLSNADKFGPAGSRVRIEACFCEGNVHVTVADEGPGIPEDQREAVFRRFYQVDGSSTRRYGGIGLGLFVARLLVVAMGGELSVDEGVQGARLRIVLPGNVEEACGIETHEAHAESVDGMLFVPIGPGQHSTSSQGAA